MAITTIKSVDGSAWLTSGSVSSANLGLTISAGDGYANGAGTFNAWDSSDPKTTKPHWSDSASYVVWSSSFASAGCFEFCSYASASSYLATGGNGVEIAFGLQLRLSSFTESTTPANNSLRQLSRILDFGGSGQYIFSVQINTRNVEGFAPGWYIGWDSTFTVNNPTAVIADVQGGGNTSYPNCHLAFDRWYHVRQRYVPPTASDSRDGQYYLWINDVLVMKSLNIDGDLATASRVGAWLAALYSWGSSLTGVEICTCGPVWAKTYPSSDHASTNVMTRPWTVNTTYNRDVRRNYHAYFSGTGSHWTTSGALSAPSVGTRLSTSGVYPGMAYLQVSATAGNGINFDTPDLWGGNSADTPFGSTGYTHISFNGVTPGASSAATGYLFAADNTTELVNWTVDTAQGKFFVNGVERYSGIVDSHWYQVVLSLTGGSCSVILTDRSNDTLTTAIARSYTVSSPYVGGAALGKARITFSGGASENVRTLGITVSSVNTCCVGDSYSSSNANSASPEYHCTAQRHGLYWNASHDGTVPGGYDVVSYGGGISGLNILTNFARSGSKLSEFLTNVKPYLEEVRDAKWLMMAYDVNDIPASVLTMAAAYSAAETMAERKITFIQWALGKGHKVVITDGYNLADAGSTFNGTSNYFRRKIPGLVSRILKQRIREIQNVRGRLFALFIADLTDGGETVISSDGIHPDSTYDRKARRRMDDCYLNDGTLPGYNTDGSVQRNASGSGLSMIESMIG